MLKWIIAGGSAFVLLGIVLVVVFAVKSGENPYEKQVEAAEKSSRKAGPAATSQRIVGMESPPKPAVVPGTPPPAAPKARDQAAPSAPKSAPPAAATPAPAPTAPKAKPWTPLTPQFVQRLKEEVLSLPPFYQGLLLDPAAKARVETLAGGAKGSEEDADFVAQLLSGARLKFVKDDRLRIEEGLAAAEKDAGEGLPVDRILLVDGRLMHCRVLEEGPEAVKVERRLAGGVAGQTNVQREQIRQVEKGKGVGSEWPSRYELSRRGTAEQRFQSYEWCKANTLPAQAKYLVLLMLHADPSNAKLRAEAGLPADPVKYGEEMSRGGIVTFEGRTWGAVELREKFLKDGFVLMEGKWHRKKDKIISVPGLFRYERQDDKPVQISSGSAPLTHDEEVTFRMIQDVASGSFNEAPVVKYLKRFYTPPLLAKPAQGQVGVGYTLPPSNAEWRYELRVDVGTPPAGTPVTGEVAISVPLEAPIIEGSVMTLAETKAGASIVVHLVTGENERTKLYQCTGKEDAQHKLPPSVKGLRQIDLVAVIQSTAAYTQKVEKRKLALPRKNNNLILSAGVELYHYRLVPDYRAVLFPSNSNTIEVFRLTAKLAEPAPVLDKPFAECPDILREVPK
jgi:hypothetical protein